MRSSSRATSCFVLLLTLAASMLACGDDTPPEPADECPEITGDGTTHGPFLETSETWTLAASPHLVPDGLSISAGAELDIEACAVVRVGATRDINVSGKLRANGESTKRVRFEPLEAGAAWGSIVAIRAESPLHFLHTTLENGGFLAPLSISEQHGVIRVEGSRTESLVPMLETVSVIIRGSGSNGVHLSSNAAFIDGSNNLTIEGATRFPIVTNAWSATTLPSGKYTGNGRDAVLVRTSERLGIDGLIVESTWDDLGVPYEIAGETDAPKYLVVGAPQDATTSKLTLSAGVELRFTAVSGLTIEGAQATLVAVGSLAEPIVFTSAADVPQPGDWLGINFHEDVSPTSAIAFAQILYAGNENTGTRSFSCGTPKAASASQQQTMGAVYFSLNEGAPSAFIQSTEIRFSASNGIDRGWTGADTDMTATNTFSDIAFCKQTEPKPMTGSCSNPPMCPAAD